MGITRAGGPAHSAKRHGDTHVVVSTHLSDGGTIKAMRRNLCPDGRESELGSCLSSDVGTAARSLSSPRARRLRRGPFGRPCSSPWHGGGPFVVFNDRRSTGPAVCTPRGSLRRAAARRGVRLPAVLSTRPPRGAVGTLPHRGVSGSCCSATGLWGRYVWRLLLIMAGWGSEAWALRSLPGRIGDGCCSATITLRLVPSASTRCRTSHGSHC